MTQERLLKLAKVGVLNKLNREYEINDRRKARTGKPSKIQEARIESLWKEYDEIAEMLKEIEK